MGNGRASPSTVPSALSIKLLTASYRTCERHGMLSRYMPAGPRGWPVVTTRFPTVATDAPFPAPAPAFCIRSLGYEAYHLAPHPSQDRTQVTALWNSIMPILIQLHHSSVKAPDCTAGADGPMPQTKNIAATHPSSHSSCSKSSFFQMQLHRASLYVPFRAERTPNPLAHLSLCRAMRTDLQ